ncbi:MAG: phosphodiester glycosidase family protein [Clostridiales bacterium]|nr:phosphodiester glycosidase family protein [Clostridiales bacterium]
MSDIMLNNFETQEVVVVTRKNERKRRREQQRRRKKRKLLRALYLSLFVIFLLYSSVAFIDIPYISQLRDVYIETAMTTADHKWLATLFFPDSLIKRVMNNKVNNLDTVAITDIKKDVIDETDNSTEHNKDILNQKGLNVGDKDYAGNKIVVNDIEQGIIISEVTGPTFKGRIALIDDPSRVFIGTTDRKGVSGRYILDMLKLHNAVLGVNASGFDDPNGKGSGGKVVGLSYSNGEKWGTYTPSYGTVAFDKDNRLVVGGINDWDKYNIRDGAQFSPALISQGKKIIKGSAGWGLQPRTVIGQRADGVVMFLVIDGRQPGHSIGATMEDCANVLLSYGAVTAGACDGGSSSIMGYNDKIMTKCSSPSKVGRLLPNAFLVKRK